MRYAEKSPLTLVREAAILIRHLFWPSSCVFCGALGELCCESCLDAHLARFGGTLLWLEEPSLDLLYGSLYEGPLRDILHRLKYKEERALGKLLGKALGRRFSPFLRGGTFVPLPLHRKSPRGYNQALLLARGMAEVCQGEVWDCLFWKEDAEPQTGKNRLQRQSLSAGALGFSTKSLKNIVFPLILVDDVSTTGSTLKAAAEVLGKEGYAVSRAVVCCFTPPPERSLS